MLLLSRPGRMLLHLCFMISGAVALITLQQPPVVWAPLGQHVVLPCELQGSQDEEILKLPVLYWQVEGKHLTSCDDKDEGRIKCLNKTSFCKSIELKDVRWSDGGSYECKMSIRTNKRGSFRLKGNRTTLVVYDTMTFNLSDHNDFLLRCEVNVSQHLGFALTVTKDGVVLRSSGSAEVRGANRTTSLSLSVPLGGSGKYECQLQLEGDLITNRTCTIEPADLERYLEHLEPPAPPAPPEHPEPWLLYTSLLLVPVLVLLILAAAMLICR